MPLKTPLYDWHVEHGAKMVDFAGFLMPVSYQGVLAEHQAVREGCGIFDISHMGEIFLEGPRTLEFLEYLTPSDVSKLKDGEAQYSLLLNEDAYPLDDILIYRLSAEKFFLCVNASNIAKDFAWIQKQNRFQVALSNRSDETGMIALQGPRSFDLLQKIGFDLNGLARFSCREVLLGGIPVILSRTGYTGEEGCELFVSAASLVELWELLWKNGQELGLMAIGLGARDTLRLEMGYALYGHELSETISPLEANLSWVLNLNKKEFIGKDALVRQKEQGTARKVVGLILEEAGIPREGMEVFLQGQKIGRVLSGTMSPTLRQGIASALLDRVASQQSAEFEIDIRGKLKKAKLSKFPLVSK